MIRALALLVLLAACGVDGPPIPPEPSLGVSVSGDAAVGLRYGF
jgi:hypothetical protein